MAIQITNDGNTLKLVIHGGDAKYVSKNNCNVRVDGNNVILEEKQGTSYSFDYTQVSAPSSASAAALAATLESYLDMQGGDSFAYGANGYHHVNAGTMLTGVTSGTYYAASFPESSTIGFLQVTGKTGDTENTKTVSPNHAIYGDITGIYLTAGSVRLYKR